MLDPRSIRANPERLKEIVRLRKVDPARADVDRWLALDEQRRALQTAIDGVNVEKKQVASLGRTDPDAARRKGQELRERSKELEDAQAAVIAEQSAIMEWLPNWIDDGMPEGRGEELIQRHGCRLCHAIDGTGGAVGPDLSGVRDRKTRAEIIEWLDDPARIKPGTIMPRVPLTPVEQQLLADHLLTR